jgi:hypothetical protein
MAFVGARTASDTYIKKKPERTVFPEKISHSAKDDLFPVFWQFPVRICRIPFPLIGKTKVALMLQWGAV